MRPIARKGLYENWLTDDALLRIQGWARDGLTDAQIAKNIGITPQTLYEWERKYPSFSDALKKGKAPVDIEVENALLKRAKGYEVEETITEIEEIPSRARDENGDPIFIQKKHVRRIRKHIPPDVLAQIFWLKNRRPGRWRDKVETAPEVGNEILTSLFNLMREDVHD